MNEETRKEIIRLIKLNAITDADDEKIETCIADHFPTEYSNEQEYINFQMEIGKIVKNLNKIVSYEDLEDGMITFDYAGHTFTMNPSDGSTLVSSDDDGSVTLDPSIFIDIDEEKKELYIG